MLLSAEAPTLAADPAVYLADQDDDFLPDVVEWAVMTSSTRADTDEDSILDFVEVVQRGEPRAQGAPLPLDHEMRIVVTAPRAGTAGPTWLHVLLRFADSSASLLSLNPWLQLPAYPGVQLPLSMMSVNELSISQRQTANDGLWVHIGVPLASVEVLQQLTPCSVHANAEFVGRTVSSGVKLLNVQNQLVSLVPFGTGMAMQPIGAQVFNGGCHSNKVCVLELREAGSSPAGTIFEVIDADCEDCNELECSPSCPQSVGWFITMPSSGGQPAPSGQ